MEARQAFAKRANDVAVALEECAPVVALVTVPDCKPSAVENSADDDRECLQIDCSCQRDSLQRAKARSQSILPEPVETLKLNGGLLFD